MGGDCHSDLIDSSVRVLANKGQLRDAATKWVLCYQFV